MQNKRKILSGCLVASLLLHVSALVFFQRYSLWFSPTQKSEVRDSWLELVEKKERDQILKETFAPAGKEEAPIQVAYKPEAEKSHSLTLSVQMSQCDFPQVTQFPTSIPIPTQELLASNRSIPIFSVAQQELFNLLDHLPKDMILPSSVQSRTADFFPLPLPLHTAIALTALPSSLEQKDPPLPTIASIEAPLEAPLTEPPRFAKAPQMIALPNLPKLPSLEDLETASYSDSFEADLVFLPKGEEGGYIFALTLIPRPDLQLPRIRQHFTFLIDRSNSIQQGRLVATKTAVYKALEELSSEDTFNIIAFDSKIEKMSPSSLPCVESSYAVAESFLEKIQLGSFFSTGDLYKALFLTVPGLVKNDEIYTAVLLTDTENLAKKQAQKALLYDWTYYNDGKVALYAIGLNNDSHLSTLEAAAAFNKGKLLHSPSQRGLKRKLLKLMKTIHTPIAKNLACKAISRIPHAKIQLFTAGMTHLYLDQPTVILGETENLDDFILFVQGRLKNRWMNIKKTISFVHAKKGNKSLKAEWALQKAYGLYERYGADGNPQHIADAARLLEPYDFQVAFR